MNKLIENFNSLSTSDRNLPKFNVPIEPLITTKERKWYNNFHIENKNSIKKQDIINNFRFNFESKYNDSIEQNLYPKLYQKFKHEGEHVVQKTGRLRTVCLICQCEILSLKGKSDQSLIDHMLGQRHLRTLSEETTVLTVKRYHDIFLNFDKNLQSQQYFFMPDTVKYVKCLLCFKYVEFKDIKAHILCVLHKMKVIKLKQDKDIKHTFSLLDINLDVYGIRCEINNMEKEVRSPSKLLTNNRNKELFKEAVNDHVIIKSIENPEDQDPLKRLPKRFDEHLYFFKKHVDCIKCTACDVTLHENDLQWHSVQPKHLNFTKLKFRNYKYFCEICYKAFQDEFSYAQHNKSEPVRHKTMASSRKNNICEYECTTCKIIIFGDNLSLRRHMMSSVRRLPEKKGLIPETVLSEGAKIYFKSPEIIIENGKKLHEDAQYVIQHPDSNISCCKDIEQALSIHFTNCKTYPFGSRISGSGSLDSDLDLFLDIGGMYNGHENNDNQFQIIKNSMTLFKKNKLFTNVTSRPTARTPIIRLKHKPTNLSCDISFRHGLSVENTKFIRFCFDLQPLSQTLTLLVKKWCHLNGLNEKISAYAFAMMTIFYLQTERYLLSVKSLKELNPEDSLVIDGWETINYTKNIDEIREYCKMMDKNIIQLLIGFFDYYSNFNYKTDVVCPLLGEIIKKNLFTDEIKGSKLPKEMSAYVKKINKNQNPEYFRATAEFCIQDPFDLSHNLTKACSYYVVDKLKTLCRLTTVMLNDF